MVLRATIFISCLTYVGAVDLVNLREKMVKYGKFASPVASVIGFMMDGTAEKMTEICKLGEKTRVGCKMCTCSDNDFKMNCMELENCRDPLVEQENAGARTAARNSEQNRKKNKGRDDQSCVPGLFFHKFCNTCVCSYDGMDMACTLKSCPPGMFNLDGSLTKHIVSKVVSHVVGTISEEL